MSAESIRRESGPGGLDTIVLCHRSGATAWVHPYGAHVTSWRPDGRNNALFLSGKSQFVEGKAIRGGIPVIFPQFGEGRYPRHGIARTRRWEVADTGPLPQGGSFASLVLEDTEETRAIWSHAFRLSLRVELTNRLSLHAQVDNPGRTTMPFQLAFHTYFAVADIRRTLLLGLQGTRFLDAVRAGQVFTEVRDAVTCTAEVDRVYIDAPDRLLVRDDAAGRRIEITKEGLRDAVVWNPWAAKARALADLGDEEYLRMLCVETGTIATPVVLPPGGAWQGSTSYAVF